MAWLKRWLRWVRDTFFPGYTAEELEPPKEGEIYDFPDMW